MNSTIEVLKRIRANINGLHISSTKEHKLGASIINIINTEISREEMEALPKEEREGINSAINQLRKDCEKSLNFKVPPHFNGLYSQHSVITQSSNKITYTNPTGQTMYLKVNGIEITLPSNSSITIGE